MSDHETGGKDLAAQQGIMFHRVICFCLHAVHPSILARAATICLYPKADRKSCVARTNNAPLVATVQKIVSEILPAQGGIAFAKEARDLLIECCVEFITLISSEANEISEKEAKKTIACDHITKALEQLGFSDYVPAVMEAAAEHKEVQKGREKKADKFANSGMSMEELARLQEEQFAQARQRHG
ncbi:CBF/NF-Y family transcription factor [Moelleriella libera RCEF 2490]|uniref:NCT transcriptional regulatory complex subunit B n=1 Tax=Moelleriella libera RCEF 2490 TaxID=1081109 RepID=A0A166UTZ5_9HYPO|nr:CBF/NF-Y family transcription factor [Moelleriella libera RCEF 2490]